MVLLNIDTFVLIVYFTLFMIGNMFCALSIERNSVALVDSSGMLHEFQISLLKRSVTEFRYSSVVLMNFATQA